MKLMTRTLLAAAVGAALLSGCTTTKTADAPKKPAAKKAEYVEVSSPGSWIPRKVRKKEDLIGDATQVVDGSALDRVVAEGSTRTVKESQLSGSAPSR